jgi:hypothetical protein
VELTEPPSPPPAGILPPADRGKRSGTVRDLVPPADGGERHGEQAGATRSGRSAGKTPARVTIGTIEVTVVPPARPAHGASEPARVPPLPPAVKRPASVLGETGSARLRNGLRRWYGIAQG